MLSLLLALAPAAVTFAQAPARAPTAVSADDADDDHAKHDHADDHAGHDDHEHAHLGHDGVNLSPDEVKGDLAIFSAIVFLLLVVILRKFAWGPIASGLEKREAHIHHEIVSAEKANAEAKHLLADYQKKLDAAQGEIKAMLDTARRDAEHVRQERVADANKEAASIVERGKREIEGAKDAALRELSQVAADQALALAGKLLQQQLKAADHARLIDEALAKFPTSKAHLN
jgi:F-type H+-transporting ATPase subunit b